PPQPSPVTTFNVSKDPVLDQVAPAVDINPTNPKNRVEAVTSVDNATNQSHVDAFFSLDGGQTFSPRVRFDGAANQDGLGVGKRFSPSVAFDANGQLYIAYGFDSGGATPTRQVVLVRSSDGGASYSLAGVLSPTAGATIEGIT